MSIVEDHPVAQEAVKGPGYRTAPLLASIITVVVLIIVPAMVALIYFRWATVHEPSTAVLIGGDGSVDGAKVSVFKIRERRAESAAEADTWKIELTRDNNWNAPILLDPGEYHINVAHRDHVLINEDFTLSSLKGIRFDLPSLIWLSGGPNLADAHIQLTRDIDGTHRSSPIDITLKAQDHYRMPVYLPTGRYSLIARNVTGDRVLVQVAFTVDHAAHAPPVIDLNKLMSDDGFVPG